MLKDPVSDGDAVKNISDGAGGIALEHQDKIFIPQFFMHGKEILSNLIHTQ